MRKPLPERRSLRSLTLAPGTSGRFVGSEAGRLELAGLVTGCSIEAGLEALRGRSVLVTTGAQLPTVLAMLALDGIAARMLLCPPDLPAEYLPAIMADCGVDAVVTDGTGLALPPEAGRLVVPCRSDFAVAAAQHPADGVETEWVLFTSGTTGRPKLVRHTLQSLTGHLTDAQPNPNGAPGRGIVWSTHYDVRRYGGLSILVRALLADASMVLSSATESVSDFLLRAGADGVTHMSGTPSHWRRALMSPAAGALSPRNVRMSGEIADQAILDRIKAAYPAAQVTHAFASTEAGVAFEVTDGLAGFPAALFDGATTKAQLRVEDGTLRIRSQRVAAGYIGPLLAVTDGFVDTGDMVERRDDRYYFVGRREGVINVGGEKVFPEEVEAIINRHPAIRMSLVWPRSSPVTGSIVAAEIVLEEGHPAPFPSVRKEVLEACRAALPAHKVPVSVRQVASLAIAESGKLVRRRA